MTIERDALGFDAPAPLGHPGRTGLPEGHPAQGKGQIDGAATAYVCRNMACGLPLTDAAGLRAALGEN